MSNLSHQKRLKLFYHSLRGKFILASVLAGVILILSSTASFIYISQSSDNVADVLEFRLKKLNETRVVMDSIWDVSYFLGEHSIAPSNTVRSLIFNKMTNGNAWLELQNEDDIFNSGISYLIQFPNKPKRESTSISGGEKTLAAIVFVLALQKLKPSPFYLFDEVDAHLQEKEKDLMSV